VARVQFPAMAEYLEGFFLADHILPTRPESARQKLAQYPLSGVALPVDIEEEGRSPTMDRQWLIEKEKVIHMDSIGWQSDG